MSQGLRPYQPTHGQWRHSDYLPDVQWKCSDCEHRIPSEKVRVLPQLYGANFWHLNEEAEVCGPVLVDSTAPSQRSEP